MLRTGFDVQLVFFVIHRFVMFWKWPVLPPLHPRARAIARDQVLFGNTRYFFVIIYVYGPFLGTCHASVFLWCDCRSLA